jgi:hypothetical protein
MLGSVRHPLRFCASAFAVTGVVWAVPAGAQPADKQQCASAYEQAQELRQAGKLREARTELLVCVQPACPEFVKADCGRWLGEVEAETPTVVFVARSPSGDDLAEVTVKVGDEVLAERLDGHALPVDPGTHTFTFEASGHDPVHKSVLINQGEKNRSIAIGFGETALPGEARDEPAPSSAPTTNAELQSHDSAGGAPNRTLSYVFAGVAAAGFAGFVIWGAQGKSQENELRSSCAPGCEESKVDEVRTKYLIADVSLGVGVVSLGVAAYLFLSSPSSPAPELARIRVDVHPTASGGFASFGSEF